MRTIELLAWLRPYLESALLLLLALPAFALSHRLLASRGVRFRPSRRHWLRLAQVLLLGALVFPAAVRLVPREALLRPRAQVWSGSARGAAAEGYTLVAAVESGERPADALPRGIRFGGRFAGFLALVLLAGAALGLGRLALGIRALRRFVGASFAVKSVGRVSVLASGETAVPFSARLPGGRACVVLPLALLSAPAPDRLITIRHELQHHRQGDTLWVYALELLRALFFWNPAIHAWARLIARAQEFACDEALIGRRGISPQAYGRCLLQAAESAANGSRLRVVPLGTLGMAAGGSGRGATLRRRIEMSFDYGKQGSRGKYLAAAAGLTLLALVGSGAYASRSLLQDRALSWAEAERYAAGASQGAEIPITVNALVLARLNRFIGTPEGRRWVREAFGRLPAYRAMLERKIDDAGMPAELLALPIFESGLRNEAVSPPPFRAAGLWQFIPATARRYDLVVNATRDDRLDERKETDAALRYLRDLHALFQDWRLALKAYNEGEARVTRLIEKYGTRDPWALEKADSTEGYLSGAMAMIILLKNPSLLD